jgi:hypothetical protein
MLTLQQIFDQTLEKLNVLGRRRSYADGVCLYRGPEGSKCAVGVWITDDMYNPEWERNGVVWLSNSRPDFVEVMESVGIDLKNDKVVRLLSALQDFHDSYMGQVRWPYECAKIESIAGLKGLTFNPDLWPEPENKEA